VDAINEATKTCANYTVKKAGETMVYTGAATVTTAAAGTVAAALGELTNNESIKRDAKTCFDACGENAKKFGNGFKTIKLFVCLSSLLQSNNLEC
jgi:hypothetical protein